MEHEAGSPDAEAPQEGEEVAFLPELQQGEGAEGEAEDAGDGEAGEEAGVSFGGRGGRRGS